MATTVSGRKESCQARDYLSQKMATASMENLLRENLMEKVA